MVVDCQTRDALEAVYAPYTKRLYRMLQNDHQHKRQPPEEPWFTKFRQAECSAGGEVRAKDVAGGGRGEAKGGGKGGGGGGLSTSTPARIEGG